MRILLAEDEQDLNLLITRALTREGYSVDSCLDGQEAIDCIAAAEYDAAVLDIMMPRADGYAVLKELRKDGKDTPVIFLTARDSISDRVQGLDSGANDYLVKPFSFDELKARLRAMTRSRFGMTSNTLTVADLVLDCNTQKVKRGERELTLSAKEYALLEYLMRNTGVILSRERIENHIWNFDYEGGTNVVDVYISYLRRKVDDGEQVKLIHTVRGRGYCIKEK
ncbi:MAG: response regulator transcription factor [Clostridia bacterium]|nr:response regulator transcription factor [Clostridia bacterium]